MALDAGSVYVKLGARLDSQPFAEFGAKVHGAARSMQAAEKSISRSNLNITRAIKGTLVSLATYEAVKGIKDLVGVMVDATKVAAGFHQELKNTQAVSGATGKQMRQLRKAALDLGTSFGVGATQAAQATTELVKGGLSVKQVITGGLKGALALAVAGQLDMADAATTVANALNLFGLRGGRATHVADALATAANATTADVHDFALALSQGGGAAKAAGLTFNETVGFLEAMANAGVKGSDAGTSMKTALVQLASPTTQQRELMKKLNLEFFTAKGAMKPIPQIAGVLRSKLGDLTKQQRLNVLSTIAGTDGMRALLALYDEGPSKLRKLEDGLKKQGTAQEVANKQNSGAQGAVRKLGASWQQAQIIFGEQLLPTVANVAQQITGKLDDLAANGSIKRFGKQVADTVSDIARDAPHIASTIAGVVHTISAVVTPIAKVLNFAIVQPFRTTLAGVLEIVSGILSAFSAIASAGAALHIPGASAAKNALDSAGDSIDRLKDKIEGLGRSHAKATISTNANAVDQQIDGVKVSLNSIPKRVVTRIQHNADSARSATLAYKAVLLGVPARKVVQILQNANSAAGEVNGLRAAIAALPSSKTITLTTVRNEVTNDIRHIQSSPFPFTPNVSRGNRKASGGRTSGPQLYMVGEGSDPVEWIIPRDPKYRGRAVGLLMDAASSILPGAKAGTKHGGGKHKPKHHKPRYVPPKLNPIAYDVDDFQTRADNTKSALSSARRLHRDIKSAETQLRRAERMPTKTASERASRHDSVTTAQRRLKQYKHDLRALQDHGDETKLKADLSERRRELRQAKAYQARIDRLTTQANTDSNLMELADKRDDQGGYEKARGDRAKVLGQLRDLLAKARGLSQKAGNTSRVTDLDNQLSQIDNDIQDTSDAQSSAAQAESDSGLTATQQATLDTLEKNIALAALTEGLGDDTAAEQAKVSFLTTVLSGLQTGDGSDTAITQVAQDLASARQDLSALTTQSASADTQAQSDQQFQQGYAAGLGQAINTGAAAAFAGVGGIGAGGLAVPPAVVNNFNMLHPGDPKVWTALARTANAGNDLMLTRRATKTKVGL